MTTTAPPPAPEDLLAILGQSGILKPGGPPATPAEIYALRREEEAAATVRDLMGETLPPPSGPPAVPKAGPAAETEVSTSTPTTVQQGRVLGAAA